ncbi:hypothetical protein GCM10023209_23840 [Roseibacterium beibuensis]|uniref:Uncharacterized protein n=1 Tax=[Roseibacterium] beibuensis TaxID=1193142 RepID=A0ABP9LFV3_9RHOB
MGKALFDSLVTPDLPLTQKDRFGKHLGDLSARVRYPTAAFVSGWSHSASAFSLTGLGTRQADVSNP